MTAQDPRPLAGEPLSVDLLNTRWTDGAAAHDLLESTAGLAVWLDSPTVADALVGRDVRADRATLDALLAARSALAEAVESSDGPGAPAARAALNEVLAHGRLRLRLDADGPAQSVETDDAAWLPAWAAVRDWLRLLGDRPDRIRACAGPECVLHFYDTSKNGTRRWCSMAGCGNRAKASRHYARRRQD
ncbi:CGNR zinc finger domain-containing protein [Streptomyces sp. NPDC051907]|uniref:CGNR zinc finger domain-containing protein n=1 Tax=Streptomyces sp. NPDC051907 TaxID=3155284 RepID=UPI0034305EEB